MADLIDENLIDEEDETSEESYFSKLDSLKNKVFRFERGFEAKLIQSADDKKQDYIAIKNAALQYANIREKISWKHTMFGVGKTNLCRVKFRGKSLCLYLPFAKNSDVAKKYRLQASTEKVGRLPTCLKIASGLSRRKIPKLIDLAAEQLGFTEKNPEFKPLKLKDIPYQTTEQLLNGGIIKFYFNQARVDLNIVDYPVDIENFDPNKEEKPESWSEIPASPTAQASGANVVNENVESVSEQTQENQPQKNAKPTFNDVIKDAVQKAAQKAAKASNVDDVSASSAINPFKNIHIDTSKAKLTDKKVLYKGLDINDGRFEMRREYILRSIDENWVSAIEEVVPTISKIIKNPSRSLQENEVVVPASLSRKVTSRSVQHLLQHVENISEINGDEVIPAKLLNVLMDETILTYENKFVNTLILRLFIFVNRRYEIAKKEVADEIKTTVSVEESFRHGDSKVSGKVHLEVELSEPAKNVIVLKNYTFTTDLWKRVERLNKMCMSLLNSQFCQEMGKAYVNPPIMRTNAILKNKDLHQCLLLWQFIEGYENAGYEMLIESEVRQPSQELYKNFCARLAEQYISFVHDVRENEDSDVTLDDFLMDNIITPKIVDKVDISELDEYNVSIPGETVVSRKEKSSPKKDPNQLSAYENAVVEAVKIALESDRLLKGEEDIYHYFSDEDTNESFDEYVNENDLLSNSQVYRYNEVEEAKIASTGTEFDSKAKYAHQENDEYYKHSEEEFDVKK